MSAVSNARDFPSDSALIAHLIGVVSDVCLLTRVARRVPLEVIGKKLRLSKPDLLILANLLSELDLVKFMDQRTEVSSVTRRPYKVRDF